MKVVVTIPCLLTGGTEIQTLNLVRALVQGGHEVITVCFFEYSAYMIEQYKAAGSKVVLFSEKGVRFHGIKCIGFLWKNLWRLKCSYHPDVVHVQYMAPGAIPIILLKLMGQRNILATAHTNADIYNSRSLRLIHFLQEHVLRVFTCITTNAEKAFFGSSSVYCEGLNSSRLPSHSHFTIYNSLPKYIEITSEVKNLKEKITIGVVSRLEYIKGMDLVIPAFKELMQRHKDIRLLVVGDGSLRQQMEDEAAALGDSVVFVGRQGQDTLQEYYDDIDILLMPSRSEGFGLTAIEGMARGCVVVASDTGGLSEVVKDGEVGLLHEPEDVVDLVKKISRLLDNKDLLIQMKTHLSSYVNRFSFENYLQSFLHLYQNLK